MATTLLFVKGRRGHESDSDLVGFDFRFAVLENSKRRSHARVGQSGNRASMERCCDHYGRFSGMDVCISGDDVIIAVRR